MGLAVGGVVEACGMLRLVVGWWRGRCCVGGGWKGVEAMRLVRSGCWVCILRFVVCSRAFDVCVLRATVGRIALDWFARCVRAGRAKGMRRGSAEKRRGRCAEPCGGSPRLCGWPPLLLW